MSAAEELEQYEYQLAQIEEALTLDPSNHDLRKLRDDLVEVIDLTRSLLGPDATHSTSAPTATAPPHSQSKQSHDDNRYNDNDDDGSYHDDVPPQPCAPVLHPQWSVGDTIVARYSVNSKLYEGTVTAVSTRNATKNDDIMYSVMFAGYSSVELVKQADTFAYDPSLLAPARPPQSSSSSTPAAAAAAAAPRKPTAAAAAAAAKYQQPTALGPAMTVTTVKPSGGPGGKAPSSSSSSSFAKKDPAAKAAKRAAKLEQIEAMHKQQQQSWQQFASGKKKTGAPGLTKKSIFATPDNPLAKVGVTGSGRGMTENKDRGKHKFQPY